MSKKIVVALTGGSGSGKTSQCKKLVEYLTEGDKPKVVSMPDGDRLIHCYTLYPKSGLAVIGKLGENQCTGLDSIYSKLGAEGVCESVKVALEDDKVQLIAIECLFFTFSWYERWVAAGIRDKFKLLFIHLEMPLFDNFRRIQSRRFKKDPKNYDDYRDVFLEDTVYKNVGTKNGETRIIYQKIAGLHEKSKTQLADECFQIDAKLNVDLIFNKIINAIYKL